MGGWIETALLLSGLWYVCVCASGCECGCAAHKRASVSAVCMQVRVRAFARAHALIGAQVRESVCVRAVSACVRACRGERAAVVVGRRGLHV